MDGEDTKYAVPKPDSKDHTQALVSAGLGAIPYVGAAASELLNALVTPSLERRRNEWMENVGSALREIESKLHVALTTLADRPDFVDIAIQASQIAIRTSSEKKLEALRNAVLNTALSEGIDSAMQSLFLTYIDTLSTLHIQLMNLFESPEAVLRNSGVTTPISDMGSLSRIVEAAIPEQQGNRKVYDAIWKDLYNRGLVNTDSLHVMMTGHGLIARRTTEVGSQFLAYINSPAQLTGSNG